MLIKCICKSCAGHLEFEEENAGQKIKCPHCGFDTMLYVPGTERVEAQLATLSRKLRVQKLLLLVLAAALVVGGLGWCIYHWGMLFLENEFPSLDSSGLRLLLLIAFCVTAPLLLLWLLLPIVLFIEWRRFVRLVARIEQHLRPRVAPESPDEPEEAESVEVETSTESSD